MTTPRPLPMEVSFGLAEPQRRGRHNGLPSPATLDAAREIGCDRVQLTLEWGDAETLDRAVAIDRELFERDLETVVALDAGAAGPWLGLDSPRRFEAWGREVASRLPRVRSWIPVIQPNLNARRSHLNWRRAATGALLRALDHQLAAHVLVTDLIHRRASEASIVCSLATEAVYELDGLLLDVLLAPAAGIARGEIGDYLHERRTLHYQSIDALGHTFGSLLVRRLARSIIPLDQALPTAIAAVYSCQEGSMDRVRRTTSPHFRPAVRLPLELDIGPDEPQEAAAAAVRSDPSVAVVWVPAADRRFRELKAAVRTGSAGREKQTGTTR